MPPEARGRTGGIGFARSGTSEPRHDLQTVAASGLAIWQAGQICTGPVAGTIGAAAAGTTSADADSPNGTSALAQPMQNRAFSLFSVPQAPQTAMILAH